MKSLITALLLVTLATGAGSALAAVPRTMSYQGVLQDETGQPVPDGSYQLTFKLYTVPSGGSALWTEIRAVTTVDGVFHTILGSTTALNLPFDVKYWLGIKLGASPEFVPRVELAAAPYALRADIAEDGDWTISGSDIYRTNGKVGIGTNVPGTKLSVAGLARIENLVWPTSGTGMELAYYPPLHRGYIQVYDRDTDTWGDLFLGNGNVGIGAVNPAEKLQVNGVIYSMSGGIKFPDGTVQTTAGGGGGGGLSLPFAGSASSSGPAFSATNNGSGSAVRGETGSTAASGVDGHNSGAGQGVHGSSATGWGVYGESSGGTGVGVRGSSTSGWGVMGTSTQRHGVEGSSTNDEGVYGFSTNASGVHGRIQGSTVAGYLAYQTPGEVRNYGVYGTADEYGSYGVAGTATGDSWGAVHGEVLTAAGDVSSSGVLGYESSASGHTYGVAAWADTYTNPDAWAGLFIGDVWVNGTLSKAGGSFKIDHPLDPENQFLSHSFVESPDMMNVYNGNATLDENGVAWVTLPDWFEVLNRDFRYQLTAIGVPAPNLHVADRIAGNRFRIAGGAPGAEVSWQVTGIRQDPWAEANRIPVEEPKAAAERGRYVYPEGYGRSRELAIDVGPDR